MRSSRARMTWQLYDKTLWQLTRGEEDWMREHFACPEQARADMRECVLLFSDQVPCWLKVAPGRQMYSAYEVQEGKREKMTPAQMLLQQTGQTLMSQSVRVNVGQKRGQGVSEQEK